jgi:hypothetical protein
MRFGELNGSQVASSPRYGNDEAGPLAIKSQRHSARTCVPLERNWQESAFDFEFRRFERRRAFSE